jgi:DNA (cytosine-5)-methyltransferase 1
MIKVATVCTGIGSPEQALKELNIPHEIIFGCEIDRFARQTYLANFTPKYMFEDMTKPDILEHYADLIVAGLPCQSFSLAGKRLGELDKRGILFYDFYNYVKIQKPKYFIIENVKGLLSMDGGKVFQNWLYLLSQSVNTHYNMFNHEDSLLYNVHWKVLNTKYFGLPQNRERVFIVGIRNDLPNDFNFPVGFPLTKRLKDVLEPVVYEKYYLSDKMIEYMNSRAANFNAGKINYKSNDDIASCINASSKSIDISDNIIVENKSNWNGTFKLKNGEDIGNCVTARYAKMGVDDNYIQEPFCVGMRGRNPENHSDRTTGAPTEQVLEPNSQGITNTITSVQKDNLIVTNRIRRLTPLECFRLQGFPDSFVKNVSDSQLYKQAGNTISINVIKEILRKLLL